jgi:nitrate reductase gamma subunit
MLFIIGEIVPYIAVAIFVMGMAWRVKTWMGAPVPFQITLFPAPDSSVGRVTAIGKELLFFSSLRRGGSGGLWFWAWSMHIMLAMIIMGHVVGIYYLTHQFTLVGLTEAASSRLSAFFGTVAGIGFFVALVALLYRRLTVPEVKRLSDPADYFDIALLLGVLVTGMMMRAPGVDADLPAIRAYLGSLIMFQPMPMPHEGIFAVHFFLVNLFLIYFPFSKLVHLAGFFVNRAMLVEAAPMYPTRKGISRDARVLKGGRNA